LSSRLNDNGCTTSHIGSCRYSDSPITSQTACSAGNLRRRMLALPLAPSACSIHSRSINLANCA